MTPAALIFLPAYCDSIESAIRDITADEWSCVDVDFARSPAPHSDSAWVEVDGALGMGTDEQLDSDEIALHLCGVIERAAADADICNPV